MNTLLDIRQQLSEQRFCDEAEAIKQLTSQNTLTSAARKHIEESATELVRNIRNDSQPGLMEQFLAEYGLSNKEGVALMCLAEAYLRTPDALSLDALIRDKIGTGDWGSHIGSAGSFLVNASTWALMLTGRMFKEPEPGDQPLSDVMLQAIGRMGESLTQKAIQQAMKILGRQFVLGRNINEAIDTSTKAENAPYRYSYDMLGEAARTADDAEKYFQAYARAIEEISKKAIAQNVHARPGVSVKLSALHPRYEQVQHERVMNQLVPKVLSLAKQACHANIGFTIDAEEADRLELSLDVIETVLSQPELADWHGFGVVVQAYSKQAPLVIKWLEALVSNLGRRITVRLVKGAYWDYEIKNAQVLGLQNYPVYTRKVLTDVSFLSCAQLLLDASESIYTQFATHNAHSAIAILEMARPGQHFEFQRLHGMGEVLHRLLMEKGNRPCSVYAPVGVHKDLLAYLVRRLLENGTNSSFVNKLLDENSPAASLVADPVNAMQSLTEIANSRIPLPRDLYGHQRVNSSGINLNLPLQERELDEQLAKYQHKQWQAKPIIPGYATKQVSTAVLSPANPKLKVGEVIDTDESGVQLALNNASQAFTEWSATSVSHRAQLLDNIADLYQDNQAELIALATLEAGKTRLDGILEIREAIDFCRYYAAQARDTISDDINGIGPVVCISPWNFPLAIFTGQIAAALVSGNPVLAKPAEQSTLMAARAVELMHQAGIPQNVLQFVPGDGASVGQALTSSASVKGVCFTGSTDTAALIDQSLSIHGDQDCRLIAETGGLNTMIVDSTALLEQAVRDIVASAFQSAGQRCSALRILCVQQEIEKPLLEMLEGAAHELVIGDPWQLSTDVGPVIDKASKQVITDHCDAMTEKGRLLFKVPIPADVPNGHFVAPVAFRLNSLQELKQEIFGPVLHVVSYQAEQLDQLIEQINDSGFGLTMGVHSRIDTRVKRICRSANVGNIYVNRNQIGAVVGTQPFGGHGLSGTGPKAGGPHYLGAFCKQPQISIHESDVSIPETKGIDEMDKDLLNKLKVTENLTLAQSIWDSIDHRYTVLSSMIRTLPESYAEIANAACVVEMKHSQTADELPGPTGENNQLSMHGRGVILCLGAGEHHEQALITQVFRALMTGNLAIINTTENDSVANKLKTAFRQADLFERILCIEPAKTENVITHLRCSAVMHDGKELDKRKFRQLLAARKGERIALLSSTSDSERLRVEKVVSTDTTASGGNASLLALGESD